jgi:predicted PurR-regulated permease PerM
MSSDRSSRSEAVSWVSRGARFTIGAALVVGLIALAIAAARVLLLVLVAIILAAGLQPVIAWLRGRLGLGRGLTILLVYGAFFVVVLGLALVILPAATDQFIAATQALPPFLDRVREWAATLRPEGLSVSIQRIADAIERLVAPESPTPPTPGEAVSVGLTVVEVAVTVVTILTVVYYWLVEHARLQRYLLAFVPADRRPKVRDTWNEVETRLGMWVRGQLLLMAAIGVATGVACFVLGVPGALLLGLISGITEAIPLVGPVLGAVPAVLMAATISPELALIVAGVYAVLQMIEGNVLVPIVMRHSVGISPFMVLLSLLVGAIVGGPAGAVLAVPVAAATELIVENLQARRKPVAQDPTVGEPDEATVSDAPDAPAGARDPVPRRRRGTRSDLPGSRGAQASSEG